MPTLSFRLLYGFLVLQHRRRQIMWLGVTASPTAEWIARQLTEACGWEPAPGYIVRDRDCAYGDDFVRRLRAMGIRDRPTAPRSPWQNAYAERPIGSIRREILDHVVVLGERHLRHILLVYDISQRCPHAPVAEQGRADSPLSSALWTNLRETSPGWIASPIRSDLIYDKDNRTVVPRQWLSQGRLLTYVPGAR